MRMSVLMFFSAIVLSGCGSGQDSASAAAPAICEGKSIGLTGLRVNFDDEYSIDMNSQQASALVSLMARGNYSILELKETKSGSNSYCIARVRIQGTHDGNSYDQVYWALAF